MKQKMSWFVLALALFTGCVDKKVCVAPQVRMNEKKVRVFPHVILIESAEELIWGRVQDTLSMVPVFDNGHHTIEIKNPKPESLHVGDIVSYLKKDLRIIHRIARIGWDEKGWFATAKGDNLAENDLEKIRPEQIIGVVIAIVY